MSRSSVAVVGMLLLLLALLSLVSCGQTGSSLHAGSPTDSTSPASEKATTTPDGVTVTAPRQTVTEPSDPVQDGGPWLGEADIEEAGLTLQNQFFQALQRGDVEQLGSLLVDEPRGEAYALVEDARERAESTGPESAQVGCIRPLVWTGERYAWDPPLPVPSDLDRWIKEHPQNRLGLQAVMGDNVLWWVGMERSSSGRWLVWPGPRDEEYAGRHTLAGLQSLVLEATPRSGVRVEFRLQQLPDSLTVTADLLIENSSDSPFFLRPSDIGLVVDGVSPPFFVTPHSEGTLQVHPGDTVRPGNGWGWGLARPTSTSTRLTYTPSDPESERRTWVGELGNESRPS